MANNKIYRTSIAMAAIIASLGCGMTTTAFADTETPSTPAATQTVEAPKAETTTTPAPDAEKPAEATPVAKIGDTTYTSLADAVKAAKDGDTITLTGKITGNTTIDKNIILQGVEGNQVNGTITVTAQGAVVHGVNFVFDKDTTKGDKADMKGAALSQLIVKADNVTVDGNTFTITRDANTTRQLNAVWVQTAKTVNITGNKFDIATHARYLTDQTSTGTDSWSWVAVNLIGGVDKTGDSTVADVTIDKNVLTIGEGEILAADKLPEASKGKSLSGQVNYVVSNGNNNAQPGVTGIKFTDNTSVNASKLDAAQSNIYGLTIMGTNTVTASGNTFEGQVAVAASKWGVRTGSTGLTYTGNTDNTALGVNFTTGSYAGKVEYKDNKGSNVNTKLVLTTDGAYTTITEAIKNSKDGNITLLGDYAEPVTVGKDQTVVFDLNGHKLTGDITNAGTLTVNDSSENQSGVVDGKLSGEGKLTVTGGKYTNKLPDTVTVPEGYAPVTDGNGHTTIIKGTITVDKPSVTVSVKDGLIDDGQIIALTGAATNLPGYTIQAVDLKPVNELISGNKNGAAKIQLQLVKDGKPLGDPVTVEVNVTVEAIPVKVTVEKDKLTVNVKDGKLDEAKLLELTGAKSDNENAVLSVDANQLDALNKAIDGNVAGDVVVGVTATWGDSSASTPVTITVNPVAFTANSFDWSIKDGELTADKALELAKPSTDVKGYTFTVDDSQLVAVNQQIKDGKTGKIELTITGTADGLPTLSQTVTVNVTDGETIKPTPDEDKTQSPVDKLANTGVNPLIGISVAGGLAVLGVAAMITRRKFARK